MIDLGGLLLFLLLTLAYLLSRGWSGPAWWWPPVREDMWRAIYIITPGFALLGLVITFMPVLPKTVAGLFSLAILLTGLVLVFMKPKPIITPLWFRIEWAKKKAEEARLKQQRKAERARKKAARAQAKAARRATRLP